MPDKRKIIAKNIAALLHDGDFVNLGVGMPTLVGNYLPEDITVFLHGENGCVGQDQELNLSHIFKEREKVIEWMQKNQGETSAWKTGHKDLNNAGCKFITLIPGACCFDSSVSFAMARGGHLDATVLGGLQVDEEGNLANWMVPGKMVNGMGGAMDLVSGAKKVIVAMEHCAKNGNPKILKKCTMPLTGVSCVDILVTELCIIEFTEGKMTVTAMAPGVTREELEEKTEATLTYAETIKEMLSAD